MQTVRTATSQGRIPEAETISVQEAASRLGINGIHAYTMIREGRFPVATIKAGSRILVPVSALDRILNGDPIEVRR